MLPPHRVLVKTNSKTNIQELIPPPGSRLTLATQAIHVVSESIGQTQPLSVPAVKFLLAYFYHISHIYTVSAPALGNSTPASIFKPIHTKKTIAIPFPLAL